MDYSTNDRITLLRKELGLSQTVFGEKLGVSRGVIKNIDEHNTIPKPEFLALVCKTYNVDPVWLKTGTGEMFVPMGEEEELLAYAVEMIKNKDLEWIKQLNLTLMRMSPEELTVLENFIRSLLSRMPPKTEKKEQE